MPPARISLTLSRHFSLSFIASGWSSGLHPVSSHCCSMYVRAGRPAFARPYRPPHIYIYAHTHARARLCVCVCVCVFVCMCVCVCVKNESCGVITIVQGCSLDVRDFEIQSAYYVYFQTTTHEKGYKTLYPHSYGLDIIIVFSSTRMTLAFNIPWRLICF